VWDAPERLAISGLRAGTTRNTSHLEILFRREQRDSSTRTVEEGASTMYAIVKTGGKQYKVAEGDVIEIEKLEGEPGAAVTLPAVLLVDGIQISTTAAELAEVTVSGEVVAHTKGPKIVIHKFKNKTGYHKRQGHRQPLTQVRVTGIAVGSAKSAG
jgi:large subunit ribosomal protein L21